MQRAETAPRESKTDRVRGDARGAGARAELEAAIPRASLMLDTCSAYAYAHGMYVNLTSEQQAMDLWAEGGPARAELIASLDEAETSIDRGEGIVITEESMRNLAEGVKRDMPERLAAAKSSPRGWHISYQGERNAT